MGDITPNVVWHAGHFAREDRWNALGVTGATLWFTGLSGSGKSTVAAEVERMLLDQGQPAYLLDGDNLRHGLNGDLGFTAEDRDENVRRVSEVARLFADSGTIALVPLVSPYRAARDRARHIHQAAEVPFFEVFIDTPIELCEQRDPKGLYAKARAGEIKGFTGIDDPYEEPRRPELVLTPDDGDPAAQARRVLALVGI
ncbi:MAG: adenylyl-sulfate kinase [Acidimicrobiia bacterium]|nr:adenylyl-sulfate kinase [Acidimicrobiia bacterium]